MTDEAAYRAALADLLRSVATVIEAGTTAIEREAVAIVVGVYDPFRDYWHVEFDLSPVVMRNGRPVLVGAEHERLKGIFDRYYRARLHAVTKPPPRTRPPREEQRP